MVVLSLVLVGMMSGCAQELDAPTSIQAIVTKENAIHLSWNYVEDATSYRIYRKENGESNFKFISDAQETRYMDLTALPGVVYIYQVTALDSNSESLGATSNEIATAEKTREELTLSPPVITSVTRLDTSTNVIFFSDENENCEYEVLRRASADKWEMVGVTKDNIYYDTAARNSYSYKVRAVSVSGNIAESEGAAQNTNPYEVFGIPVLMYHEFVTKQDLDGGVAFDEYAIYYHEFEHDLKWLHANGYTTITTQELVQYLNGQGKMPQKPVILTIDDGKLGVYKNAYPLLQQYDMKAVLSVIGSEIDAATQDPEMRKTNPAPYCTWDELAEMSASGYIEIASHSYGLHVYRHDGRIGANCAETETVADFILDAYRDAQKLQKCLENHNIPAAVAFAYPYSERSTTADAAWLRCGYQILLGGNMESVRPTRTNYFIQEAGINANSALLRRIARMHGVPIEDYI